MVAVHATPCTIPPLSGNNRWREPMYIYFNYSFPFIFNRFDFYISFAGVFCLQIMLTFVISKVDSRQAVFGLISMAYWYFLSQELEIQHCSVTQNLTPTLFWNYRSPCWTLPRSCGLGMGPLLHRWMYISRVVLKSVIWVSGEEVVLRYSSQWTRLD
jgi:hypothetical protein